MQTPPVPAYVATPDGRMHVVTRGTGPALVLLHQTPRCWDEYRTLLDHLDGYRVIVPDLPGHGASDPTQENTVGATARAVLGILDALGVPRAHVVGHHFGGLVAYHLAATHPYRVESLVLSSTPYIDAAERERRRDALPFNSVAGPADGAHLHRLWERRSSYLATPDPLVLSRYVRDVLAHPDPDRGHAAVAAYRSEDAVGRYDGPVLCIASACDPRSFPHRGRILAAFPQATEHVLGGDISSPETCPEDFAAAVTGFHRRLAGR
ncbi:alpha/beta fold hydrolase [Mycolicibacterium litorale]|uniref:Alpha/beta hydrolase n=1 Tax=Mycolicibacterium litorale TaxID=758802 RepID=A0AAD1IIF0_9MYCO|nr:alpha/beta hydrolase [Mycolicibacterium litorale]MCV7418905.1 alpha/beta fold hydrolase [Mycolicibacterium litorale]TDY00309.1 pimeloyl-ACP methyl ester carboxylesterase [Mycolicibacterium litorale]BBY15859.1 alpha/beta hydrolase [Mycolicibacterium litorale]